MSAPSAKGPLKDLRVIEMAGIGPAPFAAMLLSDLGAEVIRIERPGSAAQPRDVTARGRVSLAVDLKAEEGRALALRAIGCADVLIEGFRPGVMERLGLGPEVAHQHNPRLIYGRLTGWGQSGPRAHTAGHDINYIALTGALDAIGEADGPPVPPLNLLGDYGGGALYLVMGVLAALFERSGSGRGQVIDAAIVDGTASLMSLFHWLSHDGLTSMQRGRNMLGGAAPFYGTYRCSDDRHVAIGPLEPHFYAILLQALGLAGLEREPPEVQRERLAATFATQPRDHWAKMTEGLDACLAPVLSLNEAMSDSHMRARAVHETHFGVPQPAPAPRFSRTPGAVQGAPPASGEGGMARLLAWEARG